MEIKVLDAPPISGTVPEKHLEITGGTCTWFELRAEQFVTAIAANKGGVTGLKDKATFFHLDTCAFLLAQGQGYIISIPDACLLHKTALGYLADVLAVPGRDLVVATNFRCVIAYCSNGVAWQIDLGPGHDVELLAVESNRVRCRSWAGNGWWNFWVLLDSQEIVQAT